MEEYVRTITSNEENRALVIDKPVWEIKPKGTYSDKTFYVALGNRFLDSMVVPYEDYDKVDEYREKGYKVIDVPIDFRAKFLEDVERGLCDYAGISITSSNKYFSAQAVSNCISKEAHNPFPDIIEVGNALDDTAQYKDFFDMSKIPPELLEKPLYVHLDMSISGDMTGIAGVWITGKKPSTDQSQAAKDLQFRLAFSTSIKAPKGRQISFEKNRNFLRWLRSAGFKLKEFTTDTF